MKAGPAFLLVTITGAILWVSESESVGNPYPLAPLYSYVPPVPQPSSNYASLPPGMIAHVSPATNVAGAQQELDSRAAAAILATKALPLPTDNNENGELYYPLLMARWAYPEVLQR